MEVECEWSIDEIMNIVHDLEKKTAPSQWPPVVRPPNTRVIKLLHDEVLVRLIEPEKVNHGLHVPDSAKRPSSELWRGTVVAVGPGARTKKGVLILPDVKVGDVVGFYWKAALVDVTKWPDSEHRIIHENDIQYVIESQ